MNYFFLCLLGLCVGSFLNVVIDRLPRGESIIKNRSHCESCKKILKWYDLIPVLSFVLLKGRCRYCQSPISFQYPLVELLTGFLFVLVFLFLPNESIMYHVSSIKYFIFAAYYLFIISSLEVIFFIDLKRGVIPDKIIYPAISISFVYMILNTKYIIPDTLLSAVGSFLFFLLIFLFTKGRGMGFGDVKLAFLMGLVLGFPKIIVGLYLAFLTGAIIGFILIILRKKKFKGGTIPFGPFLVFGTWIGMFFGDKIIKIALELAQLKL